MSEQPLLDPQAMVEPLLRASPGSKALAACRRCGQAIDGLATLDERAFFIHPAECPPSRPKEGSLL